MKYVITLLFSPFYISIYSQNYELIDTNVKNYPKLDSIEQLVLRVNNSFNTDIEKSRAHYTWIANNVMYDLDEYYAIRPPEFYITFDSERINRSITNQRQKKLARRVF
ncbi:hypothetical protein [Psychroserpens algicola]|uniref:Uncharacterized protein n=1 Tax=Psychroserpens algicola TaxID=1719034 RepID=A0ABT0H8G7_9FLAO|nr:hypothetical protein [Psychroserpens algicola]MCK8480142.1 hypothetical protein [Psychroserpens algicola]